MFSFVVGVVAGGVAGFYCHDEINGYLSRQISPVREQLADGLRTMEETTSGALVRLRTAISSKLRNVEQSLRTSKKTASSGVGVISGTDPV
jgi:hypothetical protein